MRKLQLTGLASLVLALVACGGEAKPAKSPEPIVGATDGKSDMPDMNGGKDSSADHDSGKGNDKKADKADDKADKKADKGGPGGGMLTVAAMKWAPAKKPAKPAAIEVKQDGTVTVDGKTKAKIAGDQVTDDTGATVVTVSVDGSLVGSAFKSGLYKFQGDELAVENGDKVAMGDDGTVKVTKAGKEEVLGKFEGATPATKRAALVVFAMMVTDAPKPAAAKGAPAKDPKPAEKGSSKK